ncbi:hypothetical protein [Agrobacterium vitis]|uniref:hypothetical protein n=1 Tax=Agrobacterium vitis TaxID=373 RepID=UPI0012E6F7E9|nr:hypothetical protein [Agrobacterium vitis]MCM2452487.1 hypothetical protein [Agrobacterium vitis]MCM2470759.1 hypothetical protein [Agrobacterium vitis]MUO70984.1 hypothetical protein [Agrobacterium vitis]MUO86932.1 hypothetical protein [Agrobacterium vitis]MVA35852.1 hypothetical protein [Agrobacterium vitis]
MSATIGCTQDLKGINLLKVNMPDQTGNHYKYTGFAIDIARYFLKSMQNNA